MMEQGAVRRPKFESPDLPALPDSIVRLIAAVRDAKLTYCGRPKMENLARAAQLVVSDGVPGDFIEAGVALGGSAIVLGEIKGPHRSLLLYDVFAMIPPPGVEDGEDAHRRYEIIASGRSEGLGGQPYYGYVDNLIDVVRQNLDRHGLEPEHSDIHLVQGLFEQTLMPPGPIALAHVDCDWYDSVKVCIDRIAPKLSPGGIIGLDDYSSYSGCQRAVDEFLEVTPDFRVIYHDRSIGLRRIGSRPEIK
jgi:hypothetical protein